jgi:hypothetical protein
MVDEEHFVGPPRKPQSGFGWLVTWGFVLALLGVGLLLIPLSDWR